MRLLFFSVIRGLCDFACADLHRTERHVQALREWAWVQTTKLNLRDVNTRAVNRR